MGPEFASGFLSSGDNIFKYILSLCVGLVLFNIIYPTNKIKEIEIEKSKLQLKYDIISDESKIILNEVKTLEKIKNSLKDIELSKNKEFKQKVELFDLKFNTLIQKDYEIKHIERLIKISDSEFAFYNNFRKYTYKPAIIIGLISFFAWLFFFIKSFKKNNYEE
jgi:hypothetical protein